MNKQNLGQMLNAHVELAISQQRHKIAPVCLQAANAGVGVFVNVEFTNDGVILKAEPSVRVPAGEIQTTDFTNFKWGE